MQFTVKALKTALEGYADDMKVFVSVEEYNEDGGLLFEAPLMLINGWDTDVQEDAIILRGENVEQVSSCC